MAMIVAEGGQHGDKEEKDAKATGQGQGEA